ncbi:hypothetical protein KQH40_00880 [bacterium]|nr:hypothetical protein [bacterium]
MLEISENRAVSVCRSLLTPDRSKNLIEKWAVAFTQKSEEKNAVLVIATVIAAGDQEPSAITALSAAQGLIEKQAGQLVLFAGLAYEALSNTDPISAAIQDLIAEGLKNTFAKISKKLSDTEGEA